MTADETIRIVLVDDEQMVRQGLRMILESEDGFEVVGEAGDGAAAVDQVTRLDPDVVLMDIQMPGMNGLDATRRIVALGREDSSRVLVLTTFDLDEYVYEALRAGASGFLLKRTPAEDLVAGVRVVAAGEALLSPSVTKRLIGEFARRPSSEKPSPTALDELTEREREVLCLVARGLSNAELAQTLRVSLPTAKTHVSRILTKLDARDRTQLVILAYQSGIATAV